MVAIPEHLTNLIGTFGLDVSLGYKLPEMWSYLITGHKPTLGTGASNGKTIQNDGSVSFIEPSFTPTVATFTSTDTNDTFGGTGATTVLAAGINSDGYWQNEIVLLNGTTGASTVTQYYVIENAIVVAEGSLGQQGTITVTVDGQSMGAIAPDLRALLTAHWLTPINYYFYPTQQVESATTNVKVGSQLTFNVFAGGRSSVNANTLWVDKTAHSLLFIDTPFPIPPGTYVRFDATGNSGDGASIYYAGIMVHESLVKDPKGHQISAPPGTIYNATSADINPAKIFD